MPQSTLTPESAASPWRGRLKWLLRLALGALIIGALLRHPQSTTVGPLLRRIPPELLLLSIVLYLAGQCLSAWRWQRLLFATTPNNAEPVSLRECLRIYFIGMFWNLWMPTSIGGDAVRSYLAGQRIGNLAIATTSVLFDRFLGFLALMIVCFVGLGISSTDAVSTEAQELAQRVLWIALACALLAVVLLTILLRSGKADEEAKGMRGKLAKLQSLLAVYVVPQQRKVLLSAIFLSFGMQFLQILVAIMLARGVGLEGTPRTFVWVTPALGLASVIPLGIAGLGVREAAAVALLKPLGFSVGTIVAWSLLWQATVWLSSLPGGLLSIGFRTNERAAEDSR